MLSKSKIYDSTPAVLLLMALFVFGLMAMLPPSCKCPNGFTYPQCNFTNMVCLTQTMFVQSEILEPIAHLSNQKAEPPQFTSLKKRSHNGDILSHKSSPLSKDPHEDGDAVHIISDIVGMRTSDPTENDNTTSQKYHNTLRSNLFLYNAYPIILFALAAVLSFPFALWKYASVEKDIDCIKNTFKYAAKSSDEKSRLKCVNQCVNDIKFFLRFFHGNLYKNFHRMYLLKVFIPLLALLTLTFILGIEVTSIFSCNPWTSMRSLYSVGVKTFPSNGMCHFKILSKSAARSYTTTCSLPASPLLQLLTPLTITWLTILTLHGVYKYHGFRNMMSTANQNQFYRRHGVNAETPNSVSPRTLFGRGGVLLFTIVTKSDSAKILPQVLHNLRAPLEANPIEESA